MTNKPVAKTPDVREELAVRILSTEEDIRTRFILEVSNKQRGQFLGTFKWEDAVNFCITLVKEEQAKVQPLIDQRDTEWQEAVDEIGEGWTAQNKQYYVIGEGNCNI